MLASVFFFSLYCDPRDLHVLTHSFPTRRSSGLFGVPFHDFAGSVVVHAVGGWLAFGAVILLGRRDGRYRDGRLVAFAPSNIQDRKSTRLNSSHKCASRMPASA